MNDQVIDKRNFTSVDLRGEEFEQVEFRDCTFTDISSVSFTSCVMRNCNLSNAVVVGTKMQDVHFVECKMIGIDFFETNSFGFCIKLERCVADYSNFTKKRLHSSSFVDCKLHSVDFADANLSKSKLTNCDMLDAVFHRTDIRGVDFTSCHNFTIDPTRNMVRKAKFRLHTLPGLLTEFDIIVEE